MKELEKEERYAIYVLFILFLIILFLIALNGRYQKISNDNFIFDKWTNTMEPIDDIYERSK